MRTRSSVAAVAVLLLLTGGPGVALADDDPVVARVFVVHHKPLGDAFDVVSGILSAEGQITLQQRPKTLVVKDHASVLELIGPALAEFDVPPRNIDITLSLLLAEDTRAREAGQSLPPHDLSRTVEGVQDVVPEMLQNAARFQRYQSLGTKAVAAIEGGSVTVALSDDYRVVLEVGDAVSGVIQFDSLTLQRRVATPGGGYRYQDEYKAEVNVKTGQTFMLGAAKNPNSPRALFLAIQARPR